jgi:hypothetical protein
VSRTGLIISVVLLGGAVAGYVLLDQRIDAATAASGDRDVLYTRTAARVVAGAFEQESQTLDRLLASLPADLKDAKDLSQRLEAPGGWLLEQGGVGLYDQDLKLLALDQRPAGLPPLNVLLPALRRARDAKVSTITDLWQGRDKRPRVTIVQGRVTDGHWRAAVGHVRLDGPRFLETMGRFVVGERAILVLLDGAGRVLYSPIAADRYHKALDAVHVRGAARRGEARPVGVTLHEGGKERPELTTTVAAVGNCAWTVALHEAHEGAEAAEPVPAAPGESSAPDVATTGGAATP